MQSQPANTKTAEITNMGKVDPENEGISFLPLFTENSDDETDSSNQEKTKIVIFSDSHGKELKGRLGARLGDSFQVLCYPIPGGNFCEITETFKKNAEWLDESDYVIFMAGSNDITETKTAEHLVNNFPLRPFLSKQNLAHIFFTLIPFRFDRPDLNEKIKQVNGLLMSTLSRNKDISFINIEDFSRSFYTKHGLHLNNKGKEILAQRLSSAINKLLDEKEANKFKQRDKNRTQVENVSPLVHNLSTHYLTYHPGKKSDSYRTPSLKKSLLGRIPEISSVYTGRPCSNQPEDMNFYNEWAELDKEYFSENTSISNSAAVLSSQLLTDQVTEENSVPQKCITTPDSFQKHKSDLLSPTVYFEKRPDYSLKNISYQQPITVQFTDLEAGTTLFKAPENTMTWSNFTLGKVKFKSNSSHTFQTEDSGDKAIQNKKLRSTKNNGKPPLEPSERIKISFYNEDQPRINFEEKYKISAYSPGLKMPYIRKNFLSNFL